MKESLTCLTAVRTGYSSVTQTYHLGISVCVHAQPLRHVQLFVTPWTVTCQAPLSLEFPRQEYWSGLPFPSPRDLPNPGIEPTSWVSPALAGGFFTTEPFLFNSKQMSLLSLPQSRQLTTPTVSTWNPCSLAPMTQQSPGFPALSSSAVPSTLTLVLHLVAMMDLHSSRLWSYILCHR